MSAKEIVEVLRTRLNQERNRLYDHCFNGNLDLVMESVEKVKAWDAVIDMLMEECGGDENYPIS